MRSYLMRKLMLNLLILLSLSLLVLPYEQNTGDLTHSIVATTTTAASTASKNESGVSSGSAAVVGEQGKDCITYDGHQKAIRVSCKSPTHLTEIHNKLGRDDILAKEEPLQRQSAAVWLLNASIIVDNESALIIDSKDTTWLKIVADGKTENSIEVSGSLRIDSVKITSWDPAKNYYAVDYGTRELYLNKSGTGVPRPYILVRTAATGTTDITNSELAYLGYKCIGGKCSGIRYFGGDGSVIRGNNIHHNGFGFYSNGVANIVYEDNEVHHNTMYGIDPHTGAHDMIIRNNTVHDNGSIGIVCAQDCHNITIENNVVHNNTKAGILFSSNMYNSTATSNTISNETTGISIFNSHNNKIYNNTISNVKNGIKLTGNMSSHNIIDNNLIKKATDLGILVRPSAFGNTFYSNMIINATGDGGNRAITTPIQNGSLTSESSNTSKNKDNISEEDGNLKQVSKKVLFRGRIK
jgi:mannuronan 5-epimerase